MLSDLSNELHCIRSQWNSGRKCPCNYEPMNDTVVVQENKVSIKEENIAEPDNTVAQLDNACIVKPPSDDVSSTDVPSVTKSKEAHLGEQTDKQEMKQGAKEQNEGSVKQAVKKTIMERVRERLREKLGAQKAASHRTLLQEDQAEKSKYI